MLTPVDEQTSRRAFLGLAAAGLVGTVSACSSIARSAAKRPVAATADHFEIRRVERVEVSTDHATSLVLLHDPGHSLDERILREQFGY